MYFGVRNVTKNVNVTDYWKGRPPASELIEFMIKIFNWNVGDYIISGCYCECYEWNWEGNCWDNSFTNEREDLEEAKKETDEHTYYAFPIDEYEEYLNNSTIPILTKERLEELQKNANTIFHFN